MELGVCAGEGTYILGFGELVARKANSYHGKTEECGSSRQ